MYQFGGGPCDGSLYDDDLLAYCCDVDCAGGAMG